MMRLGNNCTKWATIENLGASRHRCQVYGLRGVCWMIVCMCVCVLSDLT